MHTLMNNPGLISPFISPARTVRSLVLILALSLVGSAIQAAPADDLAFFEKHVRPVLVEQCMSCHGPEKQKGGLRVDSRAALLAGGDRGSSLAPGKPGESLLLRVLAHDGEVKMPPKNKLPSAQIAAFREWVQRGAPWPNAESLPKLTPTPAVAPSARAFTAEERAYWAFQPIRKPPIPAVGSAHPIDAFIRKGLSDNHLTAAPPADARTLLRRVSFDLTGLPPTPAEQEAYLNDPSSDRYEKLVDRLLASPAYGEKWGRRWLDVVRYADSNGMDENLAYVNAWRYRDWVIRSINADKPYDQFLREQIAGDLLPSKTEEERIDQLTATGFLVIGPKMLAEDDPVKMQMDIIDEQLDTIGQAFLGLTLGCSRCHDHKFDPITMTDYYGLAGIFYSTKTMQNHKVVAVWNERPIGTKEEVARLQAHDEQVEALKKPINITNRPISAVVTGFPASRALNQVLRDRQDALQKSRPAVTEVMAVEDAKGTNLRIHLRGNHTTLGSETPRRLPQILTGDKPLSLDEQRSGRKELADWIASRDNPLTARVMVNRIWAGHFGAGLVRSPDNFGRLGERPTHPELLDWLAAEFIDSGWSMKRLHRLIVTSEVYRMSSQTSPSALANDPENRWLSHFNLRRLDAEEIRDGMLAAAGLLDRTAGGNLLKANPRQYVTSTASRNYDGYSVPRRSVYLPVIRSAVYDVLQTLDFPDPSVPNGQRPSTTIPTQALLMMNSKLADQTTEALAKAILAMPGDDTAHTREAFRRSLGRLPSPAELEKVQAYLLKSLGAAVGDEKPEECRLQAWRGLCRVLFASNEFVFVE